LEDGIANEAFKKLPGDDDTASTFGKRNKQEKETQQTGLDFDKQVGQKIEAVNTAYADFSQMPETTPKEIKAKQKAYGRLSGGSNWWKLKTLADIQTAQFFIPKTLEQRDFLTTESTYRDMLAGTKTLQGSRAVARAIAEASKRRFFHWFLEFPEVFAGRSEIVSSEIANRESTHHSLTTTHSKGFDCILGNPPFLGGQRLSGTYGHDYLEWLKYKYAPIGAVDLVTYFYRRIFTVICEGGFQSLLATNTIAQGDAREDGLAVIQKQGGTINYAIRSMRWPGLAAVEVAQVAVHKGKWTKEFVLDNKKVERITSYLDDSEELGDPYKLHHNKDKSFQGSIVLGKGFVLEPNEAQKLIAQNPKNKDVLFPYLNGQDLNSNPDQSPSRWVINFFDWDEDKCRKEYPDCYRLLEERVKPERTRWKLDENGNEIVGTYALRHPMPTLWWIYAEKRPKLYRTIAPLERVMGLVRISKYLNVMLLTNNQVFNDKVIVTAFDKIHQFPFLQSTINDVWSWKNSTTLGATTIVYTPGNCFETFPFPQNLTTQTESKLEQIGETYHEFRRQLMLKMQLGLTKTYNQFHNPQLSSEIGNSEVTNRKELQKKFGKETVNLWSHLQKKEDVCSLDEAITDIKHLRQLHKEMDEAVLRAYKWDDLDLAHDFYEVDYLPENDRVRYTISPEARKEVLKRLLLLNHEIYEEEVARGLHDKKKSKTKAKKRAKVEVNPEQNTLFGSAPSAIKPTHNEGEYYVGQNVVHPIFGQGTIKAIEGNGDNAKITIRFDSGEKKLVAKYANLGVE